MVVECVGDWMEIENKETEQLNFLGRVLSPSSRASHSKGHGATKAHWGGSALQTMSPEHPVPAPIPRAQSPEGMVPVWSASQPGLVSGAHRLRPSQHIHHLNIWSHPHELH